MANSPYDTSRTYGMPPTSGTWTTSSLPSPPPFGPATTISPTITASPTKVRCIVAPNEERDWYILRLVEQGKELEEGVYAFDCNTKFFNLYMSSPKATYQNALKNIWEELDKEEDETYPMATIAPPF